MERVLVIDDDSLMVDVMREILEMGGYTVVTATSGERGLAMTKELNPTVVITDLIMPITDGVHVINEIRAYSQDIRIIAISGTPRIEHLTRAVLAEAHRVIAKPFEQDELLDAVAQLMDFPKAIA